MLKPGTKLYRVTFEFEALVAARSPEEADEVAEANLNDICDNTPDGDISIIAGVVPSPELALKSWRKDRLEELVYHSDDILEDGSKHKDVSVEDVLKLMDKEATIARAQTNLFVPKPSGDDAGVK